jgi:hypothetical protein
MRKEEVKDFEADYAFATKVYQVPRRRAAAPPRRAPHAAWPQDRVRSHCRFVPPLLLFIPDSLRDSAPLFLKQPCDRT